MHYILIDHENVQPADLEGFDNKNVNVMVFAGNQQKVAISLIEAVQSFGENGRFVRISGNGKNALDFHIAYYLGQYAERDPQASFLLISLDQGYDPLIEHLNKKGIQAKRISPPKSTSTTAKPATSIAKPVAKKVVVVKSTSTASKPAPTTTPKTAPKKVAKTVNKATPSTVPNAVNVAKKLLGMAKSLPQKESTLRTMINAWFGKKLDATKLNQIVNELKSKKFISIDDKSKVTYSLPS